MSSSYLNKEGLARLWYQISDQFVKKEAGKGLFSGNYADLTGAPTNVSAFNNDAGYAVATEVAETYLSKTDAATTYVTLTDYNEKVAALEKADTDNLAEAKSYTDTQTAATLESAKTYADGVGSTTLESAKTYVNDAVGAITGFDFQIVDSLPETGVKGTIYLVPAAPGDNVEAEDNVYSEYLWITETNGTSKYELIGTTKMDLTGYLKEVDITYITNDEIDAICTAGSTPSNPENGGQGGSETV